MYEANRLRCFLTHDRVLADT